MRPRLEVVGRELDLHPVAGGDADVVHAHLPGDVSQHLVPVLQLDTEHGVGQRLDDRSLHQDRVVLGLGQRASPLRNWGQRCANGAAKRAGGRPKSLPDPRTQLASDRPDGNRVAPTVRISGPLSVTATVCSKCADRAPSAVTTVQPSSRSRVAGPPGVHHRLDGEHHALGLSFRPGRAGRSSGRRAPRAWPCRSRGRRTPAPPRTRPQSRRLARRRRGRSGRLPARTCARSRPSDARVTSISRCDSSSIVTDGHGHGGVRVPALDDRPAVDRDDVALLEPTGARGCRARSPRSARCRPRRERRGSRGSSTARSGDRARRGPPRRGRRSSPPAWRRPDAHLVHLGDDRPACRMCGDLLGGLTAGPCLGGSADAGPTTCRPTWMRSYTSSPSPTRRRPRAAPARGSSR